MFFAKCSVLFFFLLFFLLTIKLHINTSHQPMLVLIMLVYARIEQHGDNVPTEMCHHDVMLYVMVEQAGGNGRGPWNPHTVHGESTQP